MQRASFQAAPRFSSARLDHRLDAHLDGLLVAGEEGWHACEAELDPPSPGAMFAAVVVALTTGHRERLDALFAIAAAAPEATDGLAAAFRWVSPRKLQALVPSLARSDDPLRRTMAIEACAAHRVDPEEALGHWLRDPHPMVRARAVRATGELGRRDLAGECVAALRDDNEAVRVEAARAAVLLGDRGHALEMLVRLARVDGPQQREALTLALQALPAERGDVLLRALPAGPTALRLALLGSGIIGEPSYVDWLIVHMQAPHGARAAAEAFTLITGADLAALDLEGAPPEGFESGPTDDPDDEDVAMDPDEGLPWPDVAKLSQWWTRNRTRFAPGQRHFVGAPLSRAQALHVLREGTQRQRQLAAQHLCLLHPGTPLFDTSAPAWRQQRLLATLA